MDLKHASARGVAWNLVQNLASRLLGLVVVGVLGRILPDRSAFGAIALALTVTAFAELLYSQGYGDFIAQHKDITDDHLDTAFWLNAGLGVMLATIIAVGAHPIATWLGASNVAPIVRLLSLSIAIRAFSVVPTGLLVRRLQFRSLSMRSVVAAVFGGIAGTASALAHLGVYSLVIQVLVADVAAAVILWHATEWRPGLKLSRASLRDLSAFGWPIFGATMLNFVSRRMDNVIVVGALGIEALASYAMAQRIFQIANQVLNKSSDSVAFTALARLADAADRRREAFYKLLELTSVLCFPIYALLAIVADPVVVTIFGPRWLDSGPTLAMFALAGIPITLSYINVAAIKSTAQTRLYLVIHIILVAVYLPVLLLVVHRGTAAAAGAYLIGCMVIIPVEVFFMRASLGVRVPEYLTWLVGPSVATAVMGAATYGVSLVCVPLPALLQLVIEGLVAALVYVGALRLFGPKTFKRCVDLLRSTLLKRAPAATS